MELKQLKHGPCLLDGIISSCRGMLLYLCLVNVFINDFKRKLNGMLIKFGKASKGETVVNTIEIPNTITS